MAKSEAYWRKQYSIEHEEAVAKAYHGIRSASSGASIRDAGDVSSDTCAFECKYQGSPGEESKRKPTMVARMEKIADEAYQHSLTPVLMLRYYWPESPLADPEGWVDLSVRLMSDDAERIWPSS